MDFSLSCRLDYTVEQPSTFLFHLGVESNRLQQVRQESLCLAPQVTVADLHTSRGRVQRARVPAGSLTVTYTAEGHHEPVIVPAVGIDEVPSEEWPADVLVYIYPSRYCESDLCSDLAYQEFGALDRGYQRVAAICRWINARLIYESGSSGSTTSALQTLQQGRGVCRDYAHVGIALCRALNIPARFVSAYAPGLNPPDFHACFEAYLGHRWWLFDPTFLVPRRGIVRIGTGRDAAGVSFATILGWVTVGGMEIQMNATDLGDDAGMETTALSIATEVPMTGDGIDEF